MPIYDFQCASCGQKGEIMRKMSESNTTTCPNCKSEAFTKMLSAPSFQLNGTGWYATDFKNSNSKSASDNTSSDKTMSKEASAPDTPVAACAPGCACH
jgi:putative FmdB family regulatory protein